MQQAPSHRIASIDIFRALTMFLMIFVNDLWTLNNIPEWLGHAKAAEDRMGLSDWVFPGFLFIVGLSIPFAIQARQKKGQTKVRIFWHIIKRSFALIVMGFFMVNLENINGDLLSYSKYIWQLLMALAFVMIWNIYPDNKAFKKIPQWVMEVLGVIVLIILAATFKGGSAEEPHWMTPHWWGILGIIGWAYFLCATIYLFIGEKILYIILVLIVFHILNVMEFTSILGVRFPIRIMVSASNHVSVTSGILATLLYIHYGKRHQPGRFLGYLLLFAVISVVYGFLTRPEWGISKIRATPSWTAICAGISFFAFGTLYIISDLLKKTSWASIVGPAGRSTLTCYLVPYFYYAIMAMVGIYLPDALKTGYIGIVKTLLFAYLIIYITGLMEKVNIRLKI